jgi:hypothetical protein
MSNSSAIGIPAGEINTFPFHYTGKIHPINPP